MGLLHWLGFVLGFGLGVDSKQHKIGRLLDHLGINLLDQVIHFSC
jgi:hypothetical protein